MEDVTAEVRVVNVHLIPRLAIFAIIMRICQVEIAKVLSLCNCSTIITASLHFLEL